tara:strand:+ start:802 stop:1719 length:918 start_codon:yes stop_codon:yes gene_type:complete
MSSIPEDGTGNLSQSDAINLLVDNNSAEEVVSEDQEESQKTEPEVDTVEEDQVETEVVQEEEEEVEEPLFTVKVDGEEYDVNTAELIKSYQLEKTAQKRLQDVSEQRKQVAGEKAAIEQERQNYAHALQQLQSQLATEPEKTQEEWNSLYEKEPMEYMRQRELLRDKQEKLQAIKNEQAALQQQNLVTQQAKLLELVPEWKNSEVATREKTDLIAYLKNQGFSDQDVANATDARIISLARKASLYDQLQSKKGVVKKKVGTAPKMVKSGQPKGKVDVAEQRKREAFSKLSKSGSRDAAIEYLLTK